MKIALSILSLFSWMFLMIPQQVFSAEEISDDAQINNQPVIVMDESVLFDYPSDSAWIYTNDKFEAEYEGEAFRFHPQIGGKYVVSTGLFNVDIKLLAEDPGLPGSSITMKSYVIENKAGNIIITEGEEYYYPPFDSAQVIQQFEVRKKFCDFVESEISQDHYFEYIMTRGNIIEDTPLLHINSSQNGVITHTYDSVVGNTKISFDFSCIDELSSTNLKRYSIQYTSENHISRTVVHQFAKYDNETLTIYQIDVTNWALVPSSLSIETYKQGDVNGDMEFNISDVVLLQKWLLAVPNTNLAVWQAADYNHDNVLNVVDFTLMKRALMNA